mmetsp:Transcript_25881/g.54195  ORF Transcript_25881/g.54195 Transcript_25881/m.54195 type:complete len:90 (-) Transcript_25881:44-313(-)
MIAVDESQQLTGCLSENQTKYAWKRWGEDIGLVLGMTDWGRGENRDGGKKYCEMCGARCPGALRNILVFREVHIIAKSPHVEIYLKIFY